MKLIKFDTTKEESETIKKIGARAEAMSLQHGGTPLSRMDVAMDITATHRNGCALKLNELLEADDFNFAHDVFGITANLNRKTGELDNCFVPRSALLGGSEEARKR